MNDTLFSVDPVLAKLVSDEQERQKTTLTLIASENYMPSSIRNIQNSFLSNKYAEGYPGKRYYPGCSVVDSVEDIARQRCKKLFAVEHANVQPHAGCQANIAVFNALLKPGDTLLGMSLAAGGHLTHGHGVNISGGLYNAVQYGVNRDTELLDYDEIEALAHKYRPKLIIAGASAYARIIDFKKFADIAHSVGALLLTDIAHIAGLVATGLHPSPVGFADCITSTTHKTLRGPRGAFIMSTHEYADKIDRGVIPGTQGGPMMHTIAAKAVAFELASKPEFIAYQKQVLLNAQALSKSLAGRNYRIIGGYTENHLFIIDVTSKQLTGYDAERILESLGLLVSRSCIPFDTNKPWLGSGVRLGTPAVTTRGMKESEMEILGDIIDSALTYHAKEKIMVELRTRVAQLCDQFSLENC